MNARTSQALVAVFLLINLGGAFAAVAQTVVQPVPSPADETVVPKPIGWCGTGTLEVLETQGVPVVGVGTDMLPAFYVQDSGLPVPTSAESEQQAALILVGWRDLDAGNGLLFTVPVPDEAALSSDEAEAAISRAVSEADEQGVRGNAITPWVLARVVELQIVNDAAVVEAEP